MAIVRGSIRLHHFLGQHLFGDALVETASAGNGKFVEGQVGPRSVRIMSAYKAADTDPSAAFAVSNTNVELVPSQRNGDALRQQSHRSCGVRCGSEEAHTTKAPR